jgi:hypothetical protein
VLAEQCGTRERARSLVALGCAGLAGGVLLASLLGFGFGQSSGRYLAGWVSAPTGGGPGPLWSAVRMVQWTAAATLLGLAVIGAVVLAFTREDLLHASREQVQQR